LCDQQKGILTSSIANSLLNQKHILDHLKPFIVVKGTNSFLIESLFTTITKEISKIDFKNLKEEEIKKKARRKTI